MRIETLRSAYLNGAVPNGMPGIVEYMIGETEAWEESLAKAVMELHDGVNRNSPPKERAIFEHPLQYEASEDDFPWVLVDITR